MPFDLTIYQIRKQGISIHKAIKYYYPSRCRCDLTLRNQYSLYFIRVNKMYNGIGLQTARGSGTSGYIQKNLSYNTKKLHTKQEFLKDLQQKRKQAATQPTRKANIEIVQHERKRQILLQTMKLKKQLAEKGLTEEQIGEKIKKMEKELKQKFERGEIQTQNKDSHVVSQAKQKEFNKICKAFGVKSGESSGAFDFEAQREQRLQKMQQRRKKRQAKCPYEHCQKIYDSKERLQRHLKYKHPEEQKKRLKKEEEEGEYHEKDN